MEHFTSAQQEVLFLFGQHAVEQALKKGPEYFVKRLDSRQFRSAVRALRTRLGPERARFCKSLPPDLGGAMIHAMLDSEAWDRLVLAQTVEKLPVTEKGAAGKPRKLRPVQRRTVRTSKLDR